jgi:hypothetical protein
MNKQNNFEKSLDLIISFGRSSTFKSVTYYLRTIPGNVRKLIKLQYQDFDTLEILFNSNIDPLVRDSIRFDLLKTLRHFHVYSDEKLVRINGVYFR